jgi:hypothetical protein
MTMDVFRLSLYYIYILLINYQVKNLNTYVIFIEYYLLFNIYIYIYMCVCVCVDFPIFIFYMLIIE